MLVNSLDSPSDDSFSPLTNKHVVDVDLTANPKKQKRRKRSVTPTAEDINQDEKLRNFLQAKKCLFERARAHRLKRE